MAERMLTYVQAIHEAFVQVMADDPTVFTIGQGVWSPWYVGSSMKDLDLQFGRGRVIDTPVSENATTGMAIGAALGGLRPVVIHPRMDFMILAMDQIVNEAANWSYMFNGAAPLPMVVRAIINRGGEQGAQHAQALHAWCMHVPGLKVVMPATPADAKGLLVAAIRDPNPVIYVDDRWLYEQSGPVPEALYETPLGKAFVRRAGTDLTVVAVSYMVPEALEAAEELAGLGVQVEVVDVASIKPLDVDTIVQSVRRTGRVVIADSGWKTAGVSAELAACIAESGVPLKAPLVRVALPDAPAPSSARLERAYYPRARHVVAAARQVMRV
jgi:pyruvate/2-oxoglutarate/acetoin dehydrogenase E1 component